MLLRYLIIDRYLEALQTQPKLHVLLEDAGGVLMAAVRLAKTDINKTEKLDLEQLADIITAIKLLTNADYRSVMTKQDVGINPNNTQQLLKMLDTIPSDPAKQLPSSTRDFVRSVALMSKPLRTKELDALKALVSPDKSKRQAAQVELGKLASMVADALEKLKKKVDH